MIIGCPKEIKNQEYRIGITPSAAFEAILRNHSVLIETGAGAGAGFTDEDYIAVGAKIAATASDIFKQSDMVVKVKEPQAAERKQLRKGQILFTYLHLAPDRPQTQDLLDSGVTAIAYETVTDPRGGLPLLGPNVGGCGETRPASRQLVVAKGQWWQWYFAGRSPGGWPW